MSIFRERTTDIYEEVPGCPKPPLIPLPDPDDLEALELDLTGSNERRLTIWILHRLLQVLGFKKFQRGLTDSALERLLRRCDLRRLGQPAPAISATVNLADDPRQLSPLDRAATLVLAARQFCSELRAGTLPPDRYRGEVLEMGQYPNLFATSIIWDGWRPRIFKSTNTTHINLAVGRRLYSLDIGELGSDVSVNTIRDALAKLVERARQTPLPADEPSAGILTSANYATQRIAFRRLQKDAGNRENLQALRHGLFTLCLELDKLPETDADAAHMAHSESPGNRWHQSSLQVVVFGNARACAIFKFDACIDGNTMMRGAAEIQKRAVRIALPGGESTSGCQAPAVTELRFHIDRTLIKRARKDGRSILDNQRATFEIPEFGKRFFQARNVDPIPAFMLGLHMATVHLAGKPVRIEQQLALSKYRCMGLTTAVVTTPEMVGFSQYMAKDEIEGDKARVLLQAALDSQRQACRRSRSHLPYSQLIPLFTCHLQGAQKVKVAAIVAACKLLGIKWYSDVIVSHPSIFPEATMLGRPGARLPYLNNFGLHYRMREDGITVTLMPSTDWDIPNAEVIRVLEDKLRLLKEVLGD